MRAGKKKILLAAAACVAAGLLISFVALAAMDFNFFEMSTMEPVTNTYTPTQAFTGISVSGAECDVQLLPSENGACKVVCNETDKITHTVAVENGTLTIRSVDNRKWYEHIGFYWNITRPIQVLIYLPDRAYDTLAVRTASGTVDVPSDFSFTRADVDSASGDIRFAAAVSGDLSVKSVSGNVEVSGTDPQNLTAQSTSGDVKVASVSVGAAFYAKTISGVQRISQVSCQSAEIYATSGDVTVDSLKASGTFSCRTISGWQKLSSVTCQSAEIHSTSGDAALSDLIASESIRMETVSGNLTLIRCDAASLWLKTVSGNVNGTLLTEKVFAASTASGRIRVPDTSSGGKCEVKTTSGNITLEVQDR